ncbi:MAG: exodeoxyribonuclease VII large subunit [Balneolaceae bacterium]|nr:MAG: exodeoxyribonuclease VII large subunit [Balneolaceae bacterium]
MSKQIPFAFDVPTVSEITDKIKVLFETNFRDILVEGEISNLNQSRNGHYYFTVKDAQAQLPCVIWRSTALRLGTDLRDGQQVILGGDIQVYAPHGRYQMIVSLVQQAGAGRLQQKFEELKQKLESEGLFDYQYKKTLPSYPIRIGVITSATGAAFHDIRSTFEQRWPVATLYLHHASVQGLQAAGELVKAIEYFDNALDPVDLIIIGRGGGSLEDLWPFNEEILARAIFKCSIPVVSAVGHEVDFSISDFVADARAATPTQAVVIATPDINEMRYLIDDYTNTFVTSIRQKLKDWREHVNRLAHSYSLLAVQEKIRFEYAKINNLSQSLRNEVTQIMMVKKSAFNQAAGSMTNRNPIYTINHYNQNIAQSTERLHTRFERLISYRTARLAQTSHQLDKLNPNEPLDRGFSRIFQEGNWIRSKDAYKKDTATTIEWKDGTEKINPR